MIHTDLKLTDQKLREVEREARRGAASQAKSVAQEYADAFELGTGTVQSIVGEGESSHEADHCDSATLSLKAASGTPGDDLLKPEDIEVSASVLATF